MKKTSYISAALGTLCTIAIVAYSCGSGDTAKHTEGDSTAAPVATAMPQNGAFLDHRDSVPTRQEYSGALFSLSHDYPMTAKIFPIPPPWQRALGDRPISRANMMQYMDIIKRYIQPNMEPFFTDNAHWTSAKYGWFNEPWLGTQREAIMGAYLGNGNQAEMFKTLHQDEQGYAIVFYDSAAAYTVGKLWGKTGQKLNLLNDAAQFSEGSVIVKLAFSNINYPAWPVMKGSQVFSVYDTIPTAEDPRTGYHVRPVSFFQMDVIVKDTRSAPKTGWVYTTFVYDMSVNGSTWDKMVPLGAMWGNDPTVMSPVTPPYPSLYETALNPNAPAYSTETLGWGGRLSGPNDGAVALNAPDVNGKRYARLAFSSCMSCHSPAQDTLLSNIVPVASSGAFYVPGSAKWNLWFRDDYGNIPFDAGQVAMDYDLAMAFKSVPAYLAAQPAGQSKMLKTNLETIRKFRLDHAHSQFWH